MSQSKIFLKAVIAQPQAHYLWLRSLSYLEYIGYRKMVKTIGHQLNKALYAHLNDEIHHSYMLKESADQLKKSLPEVPRFSQELIQIAEGYFQDIDQKTDQWVEKQQGKQDAFLCYLLVSYLIEKRAMQLYPAYFASLAKSSLASVVQKILKDEQEHLAYLEEQLKDSPALEAFKASETWDFEKQRFEKYLGQMQTALLA